MCVNPNPGFFFVLLLSVITGPSIIVQSTKVTDGDYTYVSDVDELLELVDLCASRDGYYFWREVDNLTKKLGEGMPPNSIKVQMCDRFSQHPLKHTNSHKTIVVSGQSHGAD